MSFLCRDWNLVPRTQASRMGRRSRSLLGELPLPTVLLSRKKKGDRRRTTSLAQVLQPHYRVPPFKRSLESKYRDLTDGAGSILFVMTWKRKTLQSGRSISVHRASALRTSDNVSIGSRRISATHWPTPTVVDSKTSLYARNKDAKTGKLTMFLKLPGAAAIASWAPNPSRQLEHLRSFMTDKTGPERIDGSGTTLTGSDAKMASTGQLNPALSRWLQGIPPEWDEFAPTETPSTPKSRQPSSKPS